MAPGTNVVAPPREDPDRHWRRDDVDADDGQRPAPATPTPLPPPQEQRGERWDRKTDGGGGGGGGGGPHVQRLGRRGDPRMHRAVAARLADPGMSLLDALRVGGFDVRARGGGQEDTAGSGGDGVTLSQRKNQLSRRLRFARQHRLNHVGAGLGEDGGMIPRGVGVVGGGRKEMGPGNPAPLKGAASSGNEGEARRRSDASFVSSIPSSLSPPMQPLPRDDGGGEVRNGDDIGRNGLAKLTDPPVPTSMGQKRRLSQLKGGVEGDGQAKCQRDAAASFKGGRMGYFNLGNFGGVGPARTPSAMMNAQRMLHQAPMMGGGGEIGAAMVGLALGNPSPFDGVKSATTPAVNSASLTPEEGVYVNLLRQQHELQAQLLRAHLTKRHHGAMEMGGGLSHMLASPSAAAVFGANAQLESMLHAQEQAQAQANAQLGSRDANMDLRTSKAAQARAGAAIIGSDPAEVSNPIKGCCGNSVPPPSSSSKSDKRRQSASCCGTTSGKQQVGSMSVASSLAGGKATAARTGPKDVKPPSSSPAGDKLTAARTGPKDVIKPPSSSPDGGKATAAKGGPQDVIKPPPSEEATTGTTSVAGGSPTPAVAAAAGLSIPSAKDDVSPSVDAGDPPAGGPIAATGLLPATRSDRSRGNGGNDDDKGGDRRERMQVALGRYLAENTSLLKRCMIEHGGFEHEETEECSPSYLEFASMASEAEGQRVSRLRRALLLGAGGGGRGADRDKDVDGVASSSSTRSRQAGGVDDPVGGEEHSEPRRRHGRHHHHHHSRRGRDGSPTTRGNLVEDENSASDRAGSGEVGLSSDGNCGSGGAGGRGGSLSRQTNSATDADSSSSYCGLGGAPVNDGGRGDAPHTKGCNNSKSQCFNGRHIHRLMGKCGHRAIIHRPKDGPAHVDFVVDGKVECYQDAKPIDGGTNAALWPSRYNCEQLQCRTGDDDPTHEVKCFQAGSCSNSCDNIVQNLEPKEFELSSLSLDNNEWNAEFFNNGTGDETLLGMIGLGGDE